MKRGVIPWLFPLALLLALLVAVTNSPIVYGAVLIIAGWVVVPLALSAMKKSGNWPRSLGGGSDPNRRRFWGM
jgi:uncharacterized membrane protein HdeD (DUF308 family)